MRPFAPLGIAALMLVSSSARAQSDEAKAQAVQRYVEGNALHSAGKDEDAYVRFAQAYAVIQTPPVIFDLARMEQTTGRLLESARHYREYLAHPPHPKMTAEMRAKASAFLSEVNSKLGHLVIEAPSGAVITVDGKSSDAASLRSGPGSSSSACSGSANASSSCQQLASLRSAHDSDVGTETGFLVAGSMLAVAGAAVFALWHPAPRKTAVTWFAPAISRGGASVDFGLRF